MQYGRCLIRILLSTIALPVWALLVRIILLTPLAACAVHTPYPLGIKGNPHAAIAVTPVTVSAHVSSLSDIYSVTEKDTEGEQARIREALEKMRLGVDTFVRNRVGQHEGVRMEQGVHPMDEDKLELLWAKEEGADLVLAVDVAGYGQIKRKWVLLMAGTGLVEGVAQGIATAGVTDNPVIGAGVAAEEIASESLTWLGGAWLWNKYLAPVTLEGRMWRVRDRRLIWHEIQFADSSNLFGVLFGKKQPKKEDLLEESLKQAEKDLFGDLGRYIDRQILYPGKGRT